MSRAFSRAGGGPAPAGNGAKPVHSCPCGAMYSGGSHSCRQAKRAPAAPAAAREEEREPEAGG